MTLCHVLIFNAGETVVDMPAGHYTCCRHRLALTKCILTARAAIVQVARLSPREYGDLWNVSSTPPPGIKPLTCV